MGVQRVHPHPTGQKGPPNQGVGVKMTLRIQYMYRKCDIQHLEFSKFPGHIPLDHLDADHDSGTFGVLLDVNAGI